MPPSLSSSVTRDLLLVFATGLSVGVSRLRRWGGGPLEVCGCCRGAHLLPPGVSADIKRSGPLTSA